MSCCGSMNGTTGPLTIASHYDFQNLCPKSPLDLIASAALGGTDGALYNSTNYRDVMWSEINGAVIVDARPAITALGTDDKAKVEEASQWNFTHLTWDDASEVPIPLRRTMFLRAGSEWKNTLSLTLPATITEAQLGFLNNAATRGDMQGSIPVIRFTGNWVGSGIALEVVLRQTGIVRMGLWLKHGSTYYMFDMEWRIVP